MLKKLFNVLCPVSLLCLLFGMVLAIIIFLTPPVFGAVDTWQPTNQVTVAWDPVTALDNGNPLPVGNSITYKVYTKPEGQPTETELPGEFSTPQALITFSVEGRYLIGVRAIRKDSAGVIVSQSVISWSDDPVATNNRTFGVIYFLPPGKAGGLRIQ